MKKTFCRPVSLTDARSQKRIRVSGFDRGTALCALTQQAPVALAFPQPILGYWYHQEGLSVYVPGPMPAELRTAAEEKRTGEEVLLQALPAGIQEIDLINCRYEFQVMVPSTSQAA